MGRGMEGWNAMIIPVAWEGRCPWCGAALRIEPPTRTDVEAREASPFMAGRKWDVRAKEEAFHAVPSCQEFQHAELVDVCVRAFGCGPTPKDGAA